MDNTSQLMTDLALAQGAQWKAERERDEALELLREKAAELQDLLRHARGRNESTALRLTNIVADLRTFLAKHQEKNDD